VTVLTGWTALDESEPVDGSRDLLGTGAIADRIADQIAPNLRQGTSRARYYTMLAVGVHVVELATRGEPDLPAVRRRRFFRWERLWLAALFEHHLTADRSLTKLQHAIRTHEVGLLGAGIRGASARKFLELRDRGMGKIDLDEFVPLKAPLTSGVYGRYAGSARDVKILSETGGVVLGSEGERLVASFEEQLGQSQLLSKASEAVSGSECNLNTVIRNVAEIRLCRPPRRERELLSDHLLKRVRRTFLAARVIVDQLDCSTPPTDQQWRAAIPRCARAARGLDPEGEPLADALLAALGYDRVRASLEALLLAASKHAERELRWNVEFTALAGDRGVARLLSALQRAAEGFRASPEIEATRDLRVRLRDHDPSTLAGAVELLCAQHAAVCRARGVAVWVRLHRGRLDFSRRVTGATAPGLARYRLGSLASLIRDLQWKVQP
jgi:hypothetical protein